MNLTEAYELMKLKVNARKKLRSLQAARLSPTTTMFERGVIRLSIESEKRKNKTEFEKWPEAREMIEEAEDFNAQQIV